MSKIYFSGLSGSKLIYENETDNNASVSATDQFMPLSCEGMTDIEIGWDYFLIWKNKKLYISEKIVSYDCDKSNRLLEIPGHPNINFKQAIAGSENVTVLTENHDIWIYNIYDNSWKKVSNIISSTNVDDKEYIVKISQGRCTVALTNLGRVFNIPIALNNPDTVKFVDVACGYDHTLLLTGNGDIYSMGMGTRGQLGHGDLEDCDEPRLIEALAGLKVVQISACGWHSAVVTNQGDLYTWGWNNQGQLGHSNVTQNVVAIPMIVDFKNENQEIVELNIDKVQCGSAFTICKTDTNVLWGCGSNKYGQLGQLEKNDPVLKEFVPLKLGGIYNSITDFKCREWGSCIYTA